MCERCEDLERRVADLTRLVMSMGEKLLIVAEHLGKLAEQRDKRNVESHRPRTD